jgi:hypothetical protein
MKMGVKGKRPMAIANSLLYAKLNTVCSPLDKSLWANAGKRNNLQEEFANNQQIQLKSRDNPRQLCPIKLSAMIEIFFTCSY